MPAGADTVFMQEDCRVDGDRVIVPPGLKRGANRRLAGEDMRAGAVALAGRPAACGASTSRSRRRSASPSLRCAGGCASRCSRPATRSSSRDRRCRAPRSTIPTAICSPACIARFGAEVTDLGILSDDPKALARALAAAAADHDLVLTSGGVSTGEADHVRTAIESIGRIVFWRVAIKPGRPVAMGVIPAGKSGDGAAFVGLPGNPVAVFVTFVRVVRPLLLRLAGALPEPLIAMPARAAFSYKKRKGRREYVRVALRAAADGVIEAVKYAQDGAGVLTSLTETDGLAELGEDVTKVEPGATVGFLSYASLARLDVWILRGDAFARARRPRAC